MNKNKLARAVAIAVLPLAALFSSQARALGTLTDIQIFDRAENRILPIYEIGRAHV